MSTDYDTADRLYFEPLTFEDVLRSTTPKWNPVAVARECRRHRVGGQTRFGAHRRGRRGPDRGHSTGGHRPGRGSRRVRRFAERRRDCRRRQSTAPKPLLQARRIAEEIGYPLVRPSYAPSGRGMEIVYDEETLQGYITSRHSAIPRTTVLVDRFLEDAVEIDVDARVMAPRSISAGSWSTSREAIHPGDWSVLPLVTLGRHREGA